MPRNQSEVIAYGVPFPQNPAIATDALQGRCRPFITGHPSCEPTSFAGHAQSSAQVLDEGGDTLHICVCKHCYHTMVIRNAFQHLEWTYRNGT
jgi:hypothetical protein